MRKIWYNKSKHLLYEYVHIHTHIRLLHLLRAVMDNYTIKSVKAENDLTYTKGSDAI